MSENIKKKEFAALLARKMNVSDKTAEMWIDAVVETLFDCLRRGRGVVLTNFGTFYLRVTSRGESAFKFLPSQKLRALFGWSSTYKGDF